MGFLMTRGGKGAACIVVMWYFFLLTSVIFMGILVYFLE